MQGQSRPEALADAVLATLVASGSRLLGAEWASIAAGPGGRVTVRASTGDGPAPGSPLTETEPGPDRVPVAVRVSGSPTEGFLVSPDEGTNTSAIAGSAEGLRVLLLAGVDRPDEMIMRHVMETSVVVLAAERSAVFGTIRESLHEREEERRRWARELHDETLQQLGALQVLLTSALSQPAAQDGGPLVDAMRRATELVSTQIGNLRHLITELRPAALDDLGLTPPLQALARRTEQLSGIRVTVHVSLRYADGVVSTRLVPDVELAIYRIVQEALTNVRRHSTATRAAVTVVEEDETVVAEITDNGRGFDAAHRAAGFGLSGMRERAQLAKGTLEVIPAHPDGHGTTVRLIVPARHR